MISMHEVVWKTFEKIQSSFQEYHGVIARKKDMGQDVKQDVYHWCLSNVKLLQSVLNTITGEQNTTESYIVFPKQTGFPVKNPNITECRQKLNQKIKIHMDVVEAQKSKLYNELTQISSQLQ